MTSTAGNPVGLRGISFIMMAAQDPEPLHELLVAFGFSRTMRHAERPIDLYEQGEIRILIDRARGGFSATFAKLPGPCISAMGWNVANADVATSMAVRRGALLGEGDFRRAAGSFVPAVRGIRE